MYGVTTTRFTSAIESKNMTHTHKHTFPFRIDRHAAKQGARPANSQFAIEKLDTENKNQNRLMKAKRDIKISTFNTQTLQKIIKIPELITSAETTGQDILCIQEHRAIHDDILIKEKPYGNWKLITFSAWKSIVNASIGGIGLLVNSRAYSSLSNIETISPIIMVATFHGNSNTTIISCYSQTNVSEELEVEQFYMASLTRKIPKHNILVIGGDFNAQLGQLNNSKFSYHTNSNRNGNMLQNFINENNLICLNTHFQKKVGQLWTHSTKQDFSST